jgi:hypothetical protein
MPQVSVWLSTDQRAPLLGCIQAEDHPHGGGLPGPVGADEAGYLPR